MASRQKSQSRVQTPPCMITANARVSERTVKPKAFIG